MFTQKKTTKGNKESLFVWHKLCHLSSEQPKMKVIELSWYFHENMILRHNTIISQTMSGSNTMLDLISLLHDFCETAQHPGEKGGGGRDMCVQMDDWSRAFWATVETVNISKHFKDFKSSQAQETKICVYRRMTEAFWPTADFGKHWVLKALKHRPPHHSATLLVARET